MPRLNCSREYIAVAFSIVLLGACGQNQGTNSTSTATSSSTATSTTTGSTSAVPGSATVTTSNTGTSTGTSTPGSGPAAVPATSPGPSATGTGTPDANAAAQTLLTTGANPPVTPGALTTAPGTLTTAPGALTTAPGALTTAPGTLTTAPGTLTTAPGALTTTPGASTTAPASPASPLTAAPTGSVNSQLIAAKTPQANQATTPAATPAGNGQVKLTLAQFPDNLGICNVAGNEITVRDYKRMLKLQQMQMNQTLAGDANARMKMVELAAKNKVTLSTEEKEQLFTTAKRQKGTEKEFQDWLKSINGTEEKFKEEIWNTGLAFKTSNMVLEQQLLPELVNRELMAQAANELGGEQAAVNQYFRFKASKHYEVLRSLTQLSPGDVREEIVKAELAKQQLARIEKKVKVTDDDLKKVYEANKKNLKHGEQVRLAKILILCPQNDLPQMQSVRTALATTTKLTGEALDKKVSEYIQDRKNHASLLLARATAGEDFTKLANTQSQDPETEGKKNGGDLGWLEVKTLVPELAKAIEPLKKGQCIPSVVANPLGYLIFKVMDRRPEGYITIAEIRPQLQERIRTEKLNLAVQEWLAKRRTIVRVEYTPNFLAVAQGRAPVTTPTGRGIK